MSDDLIWEFITLLCAQYAIEVSGWSLQGFIYHGGLKWSNAEQVIHNYVCNISFCQFSVLTLKSFFPEGVTPTSSLVKSDFRIILADLDLNLEKSEFEKLWNRSACNLLGVAMQFAKRSTGFVRASCKHVPTILRGWISVDKIVSQLETLEN